MTLSAPNLDDRRFQDLVDDCKRLVQRRCPEWTDHNVSDPGVTLIETFAYVADQILYRVNRVPERSYVTFLELMGVELFAPAAARVDVTCWLTAPLDEDRVVEAGTQVATRRRRTAEAIVFRTVEDLHLLSCRRTFVMTGGRDDTPYDQTGELANERPVAAFAPTPQPDDVLYVGLDRAVPNCAVAVRVECEAEGHGIDPTNPPWVWEALGADGWVRCDVEDGTGGFNTSGDIVVHVPVGHVENVLEERSAGWLRCRIIEPVSPEQPPYTDTPLLRRLDAATVGGTVGAVHGEDVHDELVGVSEGVPGQRFGLLRRPVVASERPMVVEVAGPGRLGAVAAGPGVRRERTGRPPLAPQRQRRRHLLRAGGAHGRRLVAPVRRRPAGRGPHPRAPLPDRRRPQRQRRRPRDRHAEVGRAVHRAHRQPPWRDRWCRRRDARRGQGARSARARHAQPRRHGTRLRAAGQGGHARGGPRPMPARRRGRPPDDRRRRRRRVCGCSSCPRSRPTRAAASRSSSWCRPSR